MPLFFMPRLLPILPRAGLVCLLLAGAVRPAVAAEAAPATEAEPCAQTSPAVPALPPAAMIGFGWG